jgi:hypothetical protein
MDGCNVPSVEDGETAAGAGTDSWTLQGFQQQVMFRRSTGIATAAVDDSIEDVAAVAAGSDNDSSSDNDSFWSEEQLAFIESFPREAHIALGFYVAAIGIIGVVANSLVLVVFSRYVLNYILYTHVIAIAY